MHRALVLVWLLSSPVMAWAHTGHDTAGTATKQDSQPAPEAMDFYGGGAQPDSTAAPAENAGDMYGMGSPDHEGHTMEPPSEPSLSGSDLLGETLPDLAPSTPAGGEHTGHNMKSMPHIELAEHTAVSSDAKGYGAAVGITVLSGLLFGVLCLIRPFE